MRTNQIIEYLKSQKEQFEKIKNEAEARIRSAPEGTVSINKHKKGIQFYLRTDPKSKNGSYLPVSEREKALSLVQKKYDSQIAAAAGKQSTVLDRFIKSYDPDCLKKIYGSLSDVRKRIVMPVEVSDEEYAEAWQNYTFQHKEIGNDMPEHYSNKGERVRSKSEVMIADALAQADIHYRYECQLSLGQSIIHPDFTILRTSDRKQIYWEHLGMMDDPEYVIKNLRRIRLYEQNEIMPGINLILTMETSQQPINLSVIKQMIRTYCI